jgi:hypothetical protein
LDYRFEKVFSVGGDVLRELQSGVLDVVEEFLAIVCVIRRQADE